LSLNQNEHAAFGDRFRKRKAVKASISDRAVLGEVSAGTCFDASTSKPSSFTADHRRATAGEVVKE
jgi:hypothetical protein